MRRVVIVALALTGLGLFASGVRGLTEIDGHLANATERPAAQQVKQELDARDDCPWTHRDEQRL